MDRQWIVDSVENFSLIAVELDNGDSAAYEIVGSQASQILNDWMNHDPIVIGIIKRVIDESDNKEPEVAMKGSVLILNPDRVRAIRLL